MTRERAGRPRRAAGALLCVGAIIVALVGGLSAGRAAWTVIGQDTFQRANQNGWGTSSGGAAWTPPGSGLSISNNQGVIAYSGASQFETIGALTATDSSAVVRFSVGSTSNTVGILARQSGGNADLGRYDGAGHVQFMYKSGGAWTSVATAAFSPTPGALYWIRFQLIGSAAYVRMWPDGPEPSAWNINGVSNGVNAAGTSGLYGYATSGAVDRLDNFAAVDVGGSTPAPTPTPTPTPPPSGSGWIVGTVTDSVSGQPIGGVTVSTQPATVSGPTTASGVFVLGVPSGTYSVIFTAASTGHNADFVSGVSVSAGGVASVGTQPLVPIPPQTAMDLFTRPNRSGGWGTSTDGHAWSDDLSANPGARAGITGRQAFVDATATMRTDYDNWMGFSFADQEVSVDLQMTTVLNDPSFTHGARLLARVQGSTTFIIMTIDPSPDTLTLWSVVGNSWAQLAKVSVATTAGQWYHAKLDTIGTLVQGKVWSFGTAEPGWQISAHQSALSGAGKGGLRTTGAFVNYANFRQTFI